VEALRTDRPRAVTGARRRVAARVGFVLLEVVISLTILAVTLTAVLRSFTQSLDALVRLEVQTQAEFIAGQLLDEFEINPPEEGFSEGGFGEDYREYYYTVEVTYEAPDYDTSNRHEEINQFFPLRLMKIEIYYDNGRNHPFRALSVHSGIMSFERFSRESKIQLDHF